MECDSQQPKQLPDSETILRDGIGNDHQRHGRCRQDTANHWVLQILKNSSVCKGDLAKQQHQQNTGDQCACEL